MSLIIGIDLGTTNSLCTVFQDGKPHLIPNAHGHVITPSIVGVLEDGQVVVGATAKHLRVTRPDRCVSCFKRWMGTGRRIEIGGQEFNSTELSSLVLRSLREDAEKFLGCDVCDAVITVPAYFNDNQRKATKLAGEMTGLNVRRIINEPTAAALVYGYHDRQAEKNLIVVDLGGGTFDVTVMEVFEGTLEIISTAGETQLGGEDFTSRVVAWVLQKHGRQLESAELQVPLHVARLREECEAAKRKLTEVDTARIRVPNDAGEFSDDPATVQITRDDLMNMSDPLVKRLARPMSRALRDAEIATDDISEVVLVGGATRSDAVRRFVEDFFGVEAKAKYNPDEVVALGAAVQAALIEDDAAVDDMVMTEICPFTLGVEVAKDFGRREMTGYFLPIIHRNTTIPVSKEEIVQTIRPNQRQVEVRGYKGLALVLGALALFLVTIVTSGAFAVRLCWRLFAEGRYLGAFLDGLSAAGTLLAGCIASLIVSYVGRRISALRYGTVRRELIKLIRVVPLRIDELATVIAEREDEKYGDNESIDNADKIAARMRSDAAMELFSLAQACLDAAAPEPVVEAIVAEPAVENPKAPSRPIRRRIT